MRLVGLVIFLFPKSETTIASGIHQRAHTRRIFTYGNCTKFTDPVILTEHAKVGDDPDNTDRYSTHSFAITISFSP